MATEGGEATAGAGGEAVETGAAAAATGGEATTEAGKGGGDAGGAGGDVAAGATGAAGDGAAGSKAWYGELSDEADGEGALSDAAWIKNKGYADAATMVKAMRALESKVGAKPIEAPGEDASPEQVAAYRKAIGVPESADGYAFEVPEGWEQDMAMFGPMKEAALAGGMPAAAWTALTNAYKAKIIDDHNAMVDGQNAERDQVLREWGAERDQNLTLFKRGMAKFDFKPDEVQAMQAALGKGGTSRLYKLGVKLGELTEEDRFAAPSEHRSSGLTLASAKTQLSALENDREHYLKVKAGDEGAKAKQKRLIDFIASEEARQARAAA